MPSKKKPVEATFDDKDAARALEVLIEGWPHVVRRYLAAFARRDAKRPRRKRAASPASQPADAA
jgi:hypothetical protein